jgi:hypothetical protein
VNKTNFKRILRLYKEGLTTEMAINLIIMLSNTPDECSEYIMEFMHQEVFPRWQAHNFSPRTDG